MPVLGRREGKGQTRANNMLGGTKNRGSVLREEGCSFTGTESAWEKHSSGRKFGEGPGRPPWGGFHGLALHLRRPSLPFLHGTGPLPRTLVGGQHPVGAQ